MNWNRHTPPLRRSLAHGFERERSIITNASLHKRRRYVLNLDLQDFFPSINFGRVRGFFSKDKNFALALPVATTIAQIACHNAALPQGSPCSPIISNLIGHLLDSRLARFAKTHKCTYSRYADDITFSTSRKAFPAELAFPVPGSDSEWELGAELREKIEHSGFTINDKKTRMQFRTSRQVTTGLMVNEKVNIRPEYWRIARSMCHTLFATGSYHKMVPAALAGGSPSDPPVKVTYTSLDSLGGTLAYIHQVKEHSDKREKKEKNEDQTGSRKLYRRFLFYKYFIALGQPTIVPEGKTNSIYLRCATRRLPAFHPRLGSFKDGKFESNIRFMNYSSTVHDVLGIGHGASQLASFVGNYRKTVIKFAHAPLAQPVIVLVDNDDGGQKLFHLVKGKKVTFEQDDPFYYLGLNLYLVKTPKSVRRRIQATSIFFPTSVLETKVDGRAFDPDDKDDDPGKYGKMTLRLASSNRMLRQLTFQGSLRFWSVSWPCWTITRH